MMIDLSNDGELSLLLLGGSHFTKGIAGTIGRNKK